MTTTRCLRHRPLAPALVVAAWLTLTVLVLGACGSVPYAADAGSTSTPPTGGGTSGSTGGSTGGDPGPVGGPTTVAAVTLPSSDPVMPTDPIMTHGPVGPDSPVSSTDPPGRGLPTPAITGRVTDASGQPVAGLLVSVASHGDPMMPVPELGVLTGDDGRYAWPALPPGPWEVQVTRDGRTASVSVTLEAGRTATADLVLR